MTNARPLLDQPGTEILEAWRRQDGGVMGGYPDLIGLRIESFEPGKVRLLCTATAGHANLMGAVHGGVFAGLMDAATGCALLSLLGPEERFATADLHIRYLGGAPADGRELAAHAEVIRKGRTLAIAEGRTLAIAEGRVLDAGDSDTLYARASASMVIKRSS